MFKSIIKFNFDVNAWVFADKMFVAPYTFCHLGDIISGLLVNSSYYHKQNFV